MTRLDASDTAVKRARRLAELEQQRADRAGECAARSEARAQSASQPSGASAHARAATAHRQTQQRHHTAARLHLNYAQRLQHWARAGAHGARPVFMTAVAATAESRGATLTLRGASNSDALVAASDATAREAHDLETTFNEGPTREARKTSAPVAATGAELATRWPCYGPAVHELGVQSVAAVALHAHDIRLGELTIYDLPSSYSTSLQHATDIGHALVHSVLLAPEAVTTEDDLPSLALFEPDDFQPLLHQAAGKIMAANRYSIDSALAVIHAHAFAETRSVTDVAHDIIHDQLTLP